MHRLFQILGDAAGAATLFVLLWAGLTLAHAAFPGMM